MKTSTIINDCILFKCSPSISEGYNSNLMSTATVLKNVPVGIVVKTGKTAKIYRQSCGNSYTVKLHSNVHARVQAFHEYLNEKQKYRQCVDGRDYKLCKKADSLAVKMFRSGY